jgi:hypothetical protein
MYAPKLQPNFSEQRLSELFRVFPGCATELFRILQTCLAGQAGQPLN